MSERDNLFSESDTVVFPASGGFRWFALGLGLVGVAVGIAGFAADAGAVAIVILVWFGLLTMAATRQVWPGVNYLKITPQGFEVRGILQHYFVPWHEVEEFVVWRGGFGRYLGFRLTKCSSVKSKRAEMMRGVERARNVPDSIDGLLPYRYGGFTSDEMASQLNLWREDILDSEKQA
jgi:hypothetical protein